MTEHPTKTSRGMDDEWFPESAASEIRSIAATGAGVAAEGAPVVSFQDDGMPREWLVEIPVDADDAARLAAGLLAGHGFRSLFPAVTRLPASMIEPDTWPDFADAINLKALGEDQPARWCVLMTCVRVESEQLVRVCHGCAGLNVAARLWISGVERPHGAFVRLQPGVHTVVVGAYNGCDGVWLKWRMAYIAPRFTVVTEAEIAAVQAWQGDYRRSSMAYAGADEAALLDRIAIDPATVRGTDGFVRVGRSVNGRWWLIGPDGRPFYHKGCTGLNAGGTGGRRVGLPPLPAETVAEWIGMLREWGFNAMGAWTTPEFFDKGMFYTEIIEGYYVKPWLVEKFPDVFDPAWAANLDAKCRQLCMPLKDSRELIGYFLDNERGFMEVQRYGETFAPASPTYRHDGIIEEDGLVLEAEPKFNQKGLGLLQFALCQPAGVPAGEEAWRFIASRHGNAVATATAWGLSELTRESVRRLTARNELLISLAYLDDLHAFVRHWVAQYFRVFTGAIRRYDPNHLILGVRWGGMPGPAALEEEALWTDIVSQNSYRAEIHDRFDETYRASRTPILNGEYGEWTDSYLLVRNPIEPPGGHPMAYRRTLRGRDALDRYFGHPGMVGYTKYRWLGCGSDKLWQMGPRWDVVRPLRIANGRAVSLAVAADLRVPGCDGPLTGQVFIGLEGATVAVEALPPARPGQVAGTRRHVAEARIGLVCRGDVWDTTVYGNGLRGEVVAQAYADGTYVLELRVRFVPALLTSSRQEAAYTVRLARAGLEGTFEGSYGSHAVSGVALGYLHRPVPSTRV